MDKVLNCLEHVMWTTAILWCVVALFGSALCAVGIVDIVYYTIALVSLLLILLFEFLVFGVLEFIDM